MTHSSDKTGCLLGLSIVFIGGSVSLALVFWQIFELFAFEGPPKAFNGETQIKINWTKRMGYHVEMQVIDPQKIKPINSETDTEEPDDAAEGVPRGTRLPSASDKAPGEIGYYRLKDVLITDDEPPIIVIPIHPDHQARFRFRSFYDNGQRSSWSPWSEFTKPKGDYRENGSD